MLTSRKKILSQCSLGHDSSVSNTKIDGVGQTVWANRGISDIILLFNTQRDGVKPVLNWANVCSPNVLRTLRRTMIRFLTELLVRRVWFGQSKLYFILNWLVMRCKLRPELEADAQADSMIENVD